MPKSLQFVLCLFISCCFGAAQGQEKTVSAPPVAKSAPNAKKPAHKHRGKKKVARQQPTDSTGKTRTGKASFYSHKFAGKKMASGARMDPNSNNAASKTLPLGTKAKVTNMDTGKSSVVVIKDRGPYVKGRIVDLSPATAKAIGAGKKGVVPVEVTPIEVPRSDAAKPGTGGEPARDERSTNR